MKEHSEIIKRKCWTCKSEKELTKDNFNKDNTDPLGFQKACKSCQNNRMREYREKNKNYFKIKNKERYNKENNKERYLKYRDSNLERKAKYDSSIRGKLYNLLEAARSRTKKKGLELDIDLDFLLELYNKQNGKCALTNISFTFERNKPGVKNFLPHNPSIDKIDPFGGYTKNNIRIVLVAVNLALNNFGEDCFYEICKAYIKNRESR